MPRTLTNVFQRGGCTLSIRAMASTGRGQIDRFRKIAITDGEGNVIPRTAAQIRVAVAERRAFVAEIFQSDGARLDPVCATAIVSEQSCGGERFIDLGYNIVRKQLRSNRLSLLLNATALASYLCFEDGESAPALAVCAIVSEKAHSVRQSLLRARAVALNEARAERVHPAIVKYLKRCTEHGKQHLPDCGGVEFWGFGEKAIQAQLELVYLATSEEGYLWEPEGTGSYADGGHANTGEHSMNVRIEGVLAEPQLRDHIGRMAYGAIALPVKLKSFL